MKILILGAGKMGSFFCDLLSFRHDVRFLTPTRSGCVSRLMCSGSLRRRK